MSIKPRAVPPNTPITVRKVSKFDLTKRFHREVGLEPVVAYELDMLLHRRARPGEGLQINQSAFKCCNKVELRFSLFTGVSCAGSRRIEALHTIWHVWITDFSSTLARFRLLGRVRFSQFSFALSPPTHEQLTINCKTKCIRFLFQQLHTFFDLTIGFCGTVSPYKNPERSKSPQFSQSSSTQE